VGRQGGEAGGDLPHVEVVHLDDMVLRGQRGTDLLRVEIPRRGLQQHAARLPQKPVARPEHKQRHDDRGDAVRLGEAGGEHDGEAGTRLAQAAEDLAAAHVLALKLLLQGHSGRALNLGSGKGFSVREILAAIAAETGREVPHVVKPRRAGDPTCLVADASAARATLNFHTAYSDLPTIIRTAWAWHKKAHPLKTG